MKIINIFILVVLIILIRICGYSQQIGEAGGIQNTNVNIGEAGGMQNTNMNIQEAASKSTRHLFGGLSIEEMCVIDNGEGIIDLWPIHHGPVGNIHVRIYETNHVSYLHKNPEDYKNVPSGYVGHSECCDDGLNYDIIVKGPTRYKNWLGTVDEWDDFDLRILDEPLKIWDWRNTNDIIKVVFYESDPVHKAGRAHEPLANIIVSRKDVMAGLVSYSSEMFNKANKHVDTTDAEKVKPWLAKNFPGEEKKELSDLRIMYVKFGFK